MLHGVNHASDIKAPWEDDNNMRQLVTQKVKSVANELFARIVSAQYSYGTRLPAERQLTEEFDVSRTTIRQCLKLMTEHGVISRRPNSGSFVVYRVPQVTPANTVNEYTHVEDFDEDVAEITSPLDLNVVRTIVEPEMVRLATINMTVKDIANLRSILEKAETVTTSAAEFAFWDEQFHMAIAKGSHNPLLIAIYKVIDHVRRHAHWAANKEKTLSPNRISEYQKKHRAIYHALEERDMETVVEYIKLHMMEVQRDLMRET